ncbi:MAG: hypothetical protein M5U14_08230 [Acidimicrobiia bacterium]|nr:hypothetical protein [Acidimicrobiia bacterium]
MGEQLPAALLARGGHVPGHLVERRPLPGIVGRVVEGEHGVEIVEAVDRGAGLDPAGVPPDDVEAVGELLGEEARRRRGQLGARGAGAPRVHQEGADPIVGVSGRRPGQGELHRLAAGVVVVERHLQAGALEARAARPPGEPAGRAERAAHAPAGARVIAGRDDQGDGERRHDETRGS